MERGVLGEIEGTFWGRGGPKVKKVLWRTAKGTKKKRG